MEYAKISSKYYCGIDLHSRSMYVCLMDKEGNILLHRNMQNDFDHFKKIMKPYLNEMAVGVESTYNYYWLADACRDDDIPFHLGHAFYMKTIHGGKVSNDKIDSRKITDLMRSNHFPIAYPYPQIMRATRDLLRRRHYFMHIRSACLTHIHLVCHQHGFNMPQVEIKRKNDRRKLLQYFKDPDTLSSLEFDLDLIEYLNPKLSKIEWQIQARAKHHDRSAYNILISIPGVGEMLSLIILYEVHDINRFETRQKFSSYCRLVKCRHESVGKYKKGGNPKIGNPYLKWAIGEIIIHASHTSKLINKYYQKLQTKYGKKRAKSIISHKFGIAIYYMLKNKQVFDEVRFIQM